MIPTVHVVDDDESFLRPVVTRRIDRYASVDLTRLADRPLLSDPRLAARHDPLPGPLRAFHGAVRRDQTAP